MKFRTEIDPNSNGIRPIDFTSNSLFLGSCFSENIARKFDFHKLNFAENPYGILFNPASISQIFKDLESNKDYSAADLGQRDGLFFSLNHHSTFNNTDPEHVLSEIRSSQENLKSLLPKLTHVFISLGTAWVYRHLQTNSIVANCHKLPSSNFEKELLSPEAIFQALNSTVQYIESCAKDKVQFILTLSPVRHLKDGFSENSLSKAHLRTAIGRLERENKNVCYFPAAEILLDDLRDYRFYDKDLIHPSQEAVNYIWEKFSKVFFQAPTRENLKKIKQLRASMDHRPFNPESEEHKKFKDKLLSKIRDIENELGIEF